ncbi:nucleotidyl transferase AbiEii/AbiGii toxin family protein [Conexibacter stalactiti]|uniref:Nucleotidyl transferase AbiEii/AbiGii toxin family protein n=1 Tax=Conexibacter stalactiti TaxID=1940611 RepID=A0ABU4HMS8_9ACTN|nr:nucleotidyl transferase AbiEii/AbiGii toxin family protein [Conexibacter stalactiti]MDW5594014.1 nucleotidyl transferase AbiEii/AbiGii toxin family protein [Conexibacter stalactiti]MEC5034656.1 nucleotidyl transferase AbiEii/AbiGii toxin family protein [Conexibacter stalactiti]
MSVELVERGARALGPLVSEVVFLGGATLALWIDDPAAPPPRATKDVDVVVEVVSRPALHAFERRMRDVGFREDRDDGIICRWRHRADHELILDAMPADPSLLGFGGRWQQAALPFAVRRELPSGIEIRAVSSPFLVATKLEAFEDRGAADMLGSRDLDDVVSLFDGRPRLVEEIERAPADVRSYLGARCRSLVEDGDFRDAVFGLVRPDRASQARVETVIIPRLKRVAGRA